MIFWPYSVFQYDEKAKRVCAYSQCRGDSKPGKVQIIFRGIYDKDSDGKVYISSVRGRRSVAYMDEKEGENILHGKTGFLDAGDENRLVVKIRKQ